MTIEIRPATANDAELLAEIHAESFEDHWSAAAFRSLLESAGVIGLLAGFSARPQIASFILVRIAADEAEILTLATLPAARRGGLASRLVTVAVGHAKSRGAVWMFLEVAETNEAGLQLYKKYGFERVALRPRYYESRAHAAVGAVVMRRDLSG